MGDIADEHDRQETPLITASDANHYVINALTPIEAFNDHFKSNFSDDEFDTIGGLVTKSLGHLPKSNESITIGQFHFRVLSFNKRRIQLLEVKLIPRS